MVRVVTLLDMARDALDVLEHVVSELDHRELTEAEVETLDCIGDDLQALGRFARAGVVKGPAV